MGYKAAKKRVLDALKNRNYINATRAVNNVGLIEQKNLLQTRAVEPDYVAKIIQASNGHDYKSDPHHQMDGTDVHIIKKDYDGRSWYIKWHVIEPDLYFISVHN